MTRWLFVPIALAILTLGVSFYVYHVQYDQLPEKIPTHWGINGEPDKFTLKQDAWFHFYAMPALLVVWVFVTWVLPRISPDQFSVDTFASTYGYLMALVACLFAFMHGVIVWTTLHPTAGFLRPFSVGFFIFFALLGNVLGKTRKNFWIGIRTPWTLADERVWNQTHRQAGWIFVIYGVFGAGLSLMTDISPLIPMGGFILVVIYTVAYSFVLYRRLHPMVQKS
ncbi:SdpI family protein [soil metagenome]